MVIPVFPYNASSMRRPSQPLRLKAEVSNCVNMKDSDDSVHHILHKLEVE